MQKDNNTKKKLSKSKRVEELIKEVAIGDNSALEELYNLISTDIYAFALSKTGNKTDAEDILQESFLKIYRYAGAYLPQGKPMAWIFTIVLNLVRRKYTVDSRTVSTETLVVEPTNETFEQSEINSVFIKQVLEYLAEDEREIVILHIVSGLKHREIAKLIGKPLSTVLSRYTRAISKLQKIMNEDSL